jgi:hypothetical protein
LAIITKHLIHSILALGVKCFEGAKPIIPINERNLSFSIKETFQFQFSKLGREEKFCSETSFVAVAVASSSIEKERKKKNVYRLIFVHFKMKFIG